MRFSSNIEEVSMSKTAEIADLALSLREKGHKVTIWLPESSHISQILQLGKKHVELLIMEKLYTQVAGLNELRKY